MTRESRQNLGAALVAAAGILLSTYFAVSAPGSPWRPMVAPAILGLALVAAGAIASRQKDGSRRAKPWGAWILMASFTISGTLLAIRDPNLVAPLLPVLGAAGWVVLIPRSSARARTCAGA